ncbi:MAG TPA: hypothetical protein VLV54_07495 [Thermoanaerobaculia bacterium]|nr:hypothetical protein [Thermoanaerobaculia bacterium]
MNGWGCQKLGCPRLSSDADKGMQLTARNASGAKGACYHRDMKEAVAPLAKQPRTTTRKTRTKKHIVVPLTAEQISRNVGVTKKDAALVTKVLLELGYIKAEKAPKEKVRRSPAKESGL